MTDLTGYLVMPGEIFQEVRQDEAAKIADWLEGRTCGPFQLWADSIRKGEHRIVPTGQYNFAAEALPGHEEEEARGEVGVEGDRASEQPAAQENDALRPCPFCGSPAFLTKNAHGSWGHCPESCVDDGMPMEEWNTRPIEDRLREEISRLNGAIAEQAVINKHLSGEAARNFQKVLHLEAELVGLRENVATLEVIAAKARQEMLEFKQQLAEERQYTEELERRLRESEGKLCSEVEVNGMHYEGGRQEGWRACKAAVVARIREHAEITWKAYGAETILRDLALEIEEGATIQQIAGVEYDQAFDRAQLRATVEHETAQKIGKWVADHLLGAPASPVLEAVAEAVASGAWRAEEREGDNWEEVYDVWKEGENWKWARRVVCELIRWSLELGESSKYYNAQLRTNLTALLSLVEGAALAAAEGKRGDANCSQE